MFETKKEILENDQRAIRAEDNVALLYDMRKKTNSYIVSASLDKRKHGE